MYKQLEGRSQGPILGYRIGENITEEDFEAIAEEMEEVIDEHGSVRLYLEFDKYPRPELEMIDDDIKFWLKHRKHIDRYVVVGDGKLLEWSAELGDRLTSVDVKFFTPDESDEAWRWVREGPKTDSE